MNYQVFSVVALALLAYMSVWFAIGRKLQRLDVADTAWGGGFIVVAIASLLVQASPRLWLMSTLVLIWGLRLATHIWRRNAFKGPDKRYEELTKKWSKQGFWPRAYFQTFLLQGSLIFLVSLPLSIVAAAPKQPLNALTFVGLALWIFGFTFEATADKQLGAFIRSGNKGIMNRGLWRYSRHPNYFGEVSQWWALALMALSVEKGWVGLIGALTITGLILFVSGIPLTERRYVGNKDYQAYQQTTSAFVPLPPKTKF